MGSKVNLVIDQGTSFETTVTLKDDSDDLLNLTGYAAAGQVRKHFTSSNSTSFSITLGGSNGTMTLALSANSTANIVAGRYVYDVELTDTNSKISRIMEGIVTVTPQVTR